MWFVMGFEACFALLVGDVWSVTMVSLHGLWGVGVLEGGMDGGRFGFGSTAGFEEEGRADVYVY